MSNLSFEDLGLLSQETEEADETSMLVDEDLVSQRFEELDAQVAPMSVSFEAIDRPTPSSTTTNS